MQHDFTEPTPFASDVTVIRVAVDALDIEDAVSPPPEVGSSTTWLLTFRFSDAAEAAVFPGDPIWVRNLHAFRSGGVTAYTVNPPGDPQDDTTLLTGSFWGTMLGGSVPDNLPTTTGIVIGLHLRSEIFRESRAREWVPVQGSETFRRVSKSPKWFHRGEMISGADYFAESGLVIEMAVRDLSQGTGTS